MELTIQQALAGQAIGLEIAKYLKEDGNFERISRETESAALNMLEEIRRILDDDTLNDPECFQRIEAIINVFETKGIGVTRHDW